ncbi:hypothetical protein HYPSUDRAFT_763836 [Hypholoma sublateritium FD-334 SS-4]|uniref:Nephrocystin 3-like N-terminal domain-containing protein n=1 Tax=Hypholoma sublateritium (strain FD-334 SS-4) TaxID=945553 RepID=A0A0D2MBZ9_HYPSF|nr:hypothetical protein HYPSUDRAFT_763836 [Hypholoma sublateritium FD-334 SS-4]
MAQLTSYAWLPYKPDSIQNSIPTSMASSAPSQHTVEFFRNAAHTVIHGANFMSIANSATRKDGFQLLQEHVAPAAFHNSWQRADPPRCHAHTREAVLEELFDWIVGHIPREAWMAWLNGAAGAGKSAICQSFAELCIARGVKAASFFFFRTDASRNTLDPVIATLAYQIIQLFPETKELIVRTIEANPLIFEQAFETQLDALIVAPIRRLQQADASFTLLLIIDGLDECTEERPQMVLVEAFGKLLRNKDLPLLALFGSRRESHIQMTFNVRHVDGILKQMPLDNNYQAPADIRRFLVERFADIKLTHPQNKRLDSAWPAADHVQQIVEKSSGQFVYASVIVKFASMPSPNPATQLDIVRGLRPAGRTTPFAELDALYRHIFSQVKDIAPALRLLAYNILGSVTYVKRAFYFFDIREDEAESIFAPLASVLSYDAETARITFHHTSLPDFLKDKERPQEYCISEMGTDLSILWFKNAISGRFKDLSEDDQNFDILRFLDCAKGCPDLRALILYYPPPQTPWAYKTDFFPPVILRRIREIVRAHL